MPDAGLDGPPEQESSERTAFDEAISTLAEGEITFPAPFDYATSSALARNIDAGRIAELLFGVDRDRELDFRLTLFARSADQPELPEREIVNTVVGGKASLINLLDDLIEHLMQQQREEKGD